jgi:hypothetical protein
MELALERDDTSAKFANVTKRMKDAAGNPIDTAHDNPILDTRLYEVEYLDRHKAAMAASVIAENMLAQVDHDGNRQILFETITYHRNDGTELQEGEPSIKNSSRVTRNVETTKGWECLIQWHNRSTTWNKMKDIKDSCPVQQAQTPASLQMVGNVRPEEEGPYHQEDQGELVLGQNSQVWVRSSRELQGLPAHR